MEVDAVRWGVEWRWEGEEVEMTEGVERGATAFRSPAPLSHASEGRAEPP